MNTLQNAIAAMPNGKMIKHDSAGTPVNIERLTKKELLSYIEIWRPDVSKARLINLFTQTD